MRVTVIHGRELSPSEHRAWLNLQSADPALISPYFRPEFAETVALARRDVYVGVMHENGQIVGFFPFQRGPGGWGRPVGGALSDYHGVIAAARAEWSPRELLAGCGLSVWEFDHLPAGEARFAPYHQGHSQSPSMDLAGGYEQYCRQRRAGGSELIKKTENLARRLHREVGPLRFEPEVRDVAVLTQVIRWKSEQCSHSGVPDFLSRPWVRQLLERLFATRGSEFAGVLSGLWAGDRLVAAHFGMRAGHVLHYWFPAYNGSLSKYSAGLILLLRMAAWAPSQGIRFVDMGKGDAPYKQRLMNASFPLAEGSVSATAWVSHCRRFRRGVEQWATRLPVPATSRLARGVLRRWDQWMHYR